MSENAARSRSKEILFNNGKSFWFASFFLSRHASRKAITLYAFCRLLDDWADSGGEAGPAKLDTLLDMFRNFVDSQSSWTTQLFSIQGFTQYEAELIVEFLELKLSLPIVQELLKGLQKDTECALVQEKSELVMYAYRVAGTVGLLMAQILGADTEKAKHHAVDLGIAMQLTNVCRDVLEDACMGRRYLPIGWAPENIAEADYKTRQIVRDSIEEILHLADAYYESGVRGICYLPKRSRFAVYLMAKIYRHIGILILHRKITWWKERVYVPMHTKIYLTLLALPKILFHLVSNRAQNEENSEHDARLHKSLIGLPGVHQ